MTVSVLESGEEYTPQQALLNALNDAENMESVVIAYFKGDEGEAFLQMSKTTVRDLLFLGKAIEHYAMKGE